MYNMFRLQILQVSEDRCNITISNSNPLTPESVKTRTRQETGEAAHSGSSLGVV